MSDETVVIKKKKKDPKYRFGTTSREEQYQSLIDNCIYQEDNSYIYIFEDMLKEFEVKYTKDENKYFITGHNLVVVLLDIYEDSTLNENSYKDKSYHLKMYKELTSDGARAIFIMSDEILQKEDIVKSRIANLLNKIVDKDKIIYARKCNIKVIDSKTRTDFLKENHIQGPDNAGIRYGLFYDKKLVSVMTFGLGSVSKGIKKDKNKVAYELSRFCSLKDYRVVGAASKLFKHFINNNEIDKIFSFADLRWSVANVYFNLGFVLSSISEPNYYYICDGKRKHRFNFRKDTLVNMKGYDDNKTEIQVMYENGIPRIFDLGNYKLTYEKK